MLSNFAIASANDFLSKEMWLDSIAVSHGLFPMKVAP